MKNCCKVTAEVIVSILLAFTAVGLQSASAQTYDVPDLMYFKFDQTGSTVDNDAKLPTKVSTSASLQGGMAMSGAGMAGGALTDASPGGNNNYVSTGWKNQLGTGSWTLSFWMDDFPTSVVSERYFLGENTGSNLRLYTGGTAGSNNLLLQATGMNDVKISSLGSGPFTVHFVYDSAASEIRAYVNGKLATTVSQNNLDLKGTGNFKIGKYDPNVTGFPPNTVMDEFRLYNRALGVAEIYATWNHTLPYTARPMKVSGVEVFQYHDSSFAGKTDTRILNIRVNVQDILNPLKVTEMHFTTSGTTNAGDIKRARLYHTDTSLQPLSAPFDRATDSAGAEVSSPSGSFSFTLNRALQEGENQFYLVYDVDENAAYQNELDAVVSHVVISGNSYLPTTGDPFGAVPIDSFGHYCPITVINKAATTSVILGLTNVKLGNSINNFSADLDTVTFYRNQVLRVYRQDSVPVEIKHGQGNNEQIAAWIDWNSDGFFDNTTERLFYKANNPLAQTYFTGFKVPCGIRAGFYKIRIMSDWAGSPAITPCATLQYGDAEEYLIEVLDNPSGITATFKPELPPYHVSSPIQFKSTTSAAGKVIYEWDFDNDGVYDATGAGPAYTYTTTGKKTITLKVTQAGCSGNVTYTVTDTLTVTPPKKTPNSGFVALQYITNVNDPIQFLDASSEKPNQWLWQVNPAMIEGNPTYTFVNGTNSGSRDPQIQFLQEGKYQVVLTTWNALGKGTTEAKDNYIEVTGSVQMCNVTDTIKMANGYLYDDGGRNQPYANNRNCAVVIKPPCAESITVQFNSFDVSIYQTGATPAGDYIRLFDGANVGGVSLHAAAGSSWGFQNRFPLNAPFSPPSVTAKSGAMYIQWHSDAGYVGDGFEIMWTSVLRTDVPPVAAMEAPDSAYIKTPVAFRSLSTGNELQYFWDLDGDGVTDATTPDATFTYPQEGIYNARLITRNCGGVDTVTKLILVKKPNSKPDADFRADYTRVSIGDKLQLTDLSTMGPFAWEWSIVNTANAKAVFFFQDGTTALSKDPKIIFQDTGSYTISLKARNDLGEDIATKTKYLHVYRHCEPFVLAKHSSADIAHIKLTDVNGNVLINQAIGEDQQGYTQHQLSSPPLLEVGGYYTLEVTRPDSNHSVSSYVWVDYDADGLFDGFMEAVDSQKNITSNTWKLTIFIPLSINEGISRIRVGVGYKGDPQACGYNMFADFHDFTVYLSPDYVKPVITLNGPDTLLLEEYRPFTDPKGKATDNVDGDITHKIKVSGTVDTSKLGNYLLTYNAVDRAGNNAIPVQRVVQVIKDTSAPVVTLKGPDPFILLVNEPFIDPGIEIDENGPPSSVTVVRQHNIDSSQFGEYEVAYDVTDDDGHHTKLVRQVVVADTMSPAIALTGPTIIKHQVTETYTDSGAVIQDNYWTDVKIWDSTNLNVDSIGTYFYTWKAKDKSGNISTATRIIEVEDYIKPIIKLIDDTVYWHVNRKYAPPGLIMRDNYYHHNTLTLLTTGFINEYKISTQQVTYRARDGSGNISDPVTLTVIVADLQAPNLKLNGPEYIELKRWETFYDPGYTTSDNYDTIPKVIISGSFKNTQVPGIYTRFYQAVDKAGNKSHIKFRWIVVTEDTTTGIAEEEAARWLVMYPNPATAQVRISWHAEQQGQVKLYLTDVTGRKVKELWEGSSLHNVLDMKVDDLPAGIYHLHFESGSRQAVKRLVITH